ncbi:MAG: hypothetical protein LBM60_03605 [Clostridium sp.]|jgi:hypothetical protein|nr:hypothetical protein [Clostridium sp.]
MSASGMSWLFGGGVINQNDTSVQSFDIEAQLKLVGRDMEYTLDEMLTCSYVQMATGTVEAIVDVVMLFGTFGIGNVVKGIAKGAALDIGITLAVQGALKLIIPGVAAALAKNLATNALGEDLGNAIISGANMYLGKNHQGGGGSPGDTEIVSAYRRETEAILAEEAEQERRGRSPFDASSQYTFLGSLLYSMLPMATASSGLGLLSKLGTLTQSSLAALLPSASALSSARLEMLRGYCPTLEEMGIVADVYCNPLYASDLSTIGMDPGDVFEHVSKLGGGNNFKKQGGQIVVDAYDNPVINMNSNLGKYIVFCGQRESQYGVADANISATFSMINTGDGIADAVLSGGLGALPVAGGLADAADAASQAANAPWIGGQICVASDEKNPQWRDEYRYYQRYVEDQRLMESMGIIEKSSVTLGLDEYYEENPLDDSMEGILARYSGLSKEQVIATLDLVDYASFLAEYEPSELAPLIANNAANLSLAEQLPRAEVAGHRDSPTQQYIIYNDTRDRNFAA